MPGRVLIQGQSPVVPLRGAGVPGAPVEGLVGVEAVLLVFLRARGAKGGGGVQEEGVPVEGPVGSLVREGVPGGQPEGVTEAAVEGAAP